MRNKIFSAKALCRSGVIAALYVALTVPFVSLSFFGGLQVRPSEGLCLLPLFYPEAVFALAAGCFITNLFSSFAVFDITMGVAATLLAAICTRLAGKAFRGGKKTLPLKIALGGLFPVLFNAAFVPIIVFLGDPNGAAITFAAYFAVAGSVALGEAIWVYAVGTPLILFCDRRQAKNDPLFAPSDKKPIKNTENTVETDKIVG